MLVIQTDPVTVLPLVTKSIDTNDIDSIFLVSMKKMFQGYKRFSKK